MLPVLVLVLISRCHFHIVAVYMVVNLLACALVLLCTCISQNMYFCDPTDTKPLPNWMKKCLFLRNNRVDVDEVEEVTEKSCTFPLPNSTNLSYFN